MKRHVLNISIGRWKSRSVQLLVARSQVSRLALAFGLASACRAGVAERGLTSNAGSKAVSNSETTATAQTTQLDKLAEQLGFPFPADARLLATGSEHGIDDAVYAKVEVRSSELVDFLKRSPLANETFAREKRFLLGKNRAGGWDPEAPRELPTAQGELPNGSIVNLGYDESKPGVAILYLFWHET